MTAVMDQSADPVQLDADRQNPTMQICRASQGGAMLLLAVVEYQVDHIMAIILVVSVASLDGAPSVISLIRRT